MPRRETLESVLLLENRVPGPVASIYDLNAFQVALFSSQEPYASIQRAVVRAKKTEEAGRVDVVINHGWVLPVYDVVHANARRPPIAAKTELTLHCGIYREEIRESKLAGAGNDLPELVDRDKAKP